MMQSVQIPTLTHGEAPARTHQAAKLAGDKRGEALQVAKPAGSQRAAQDDGGMRGVGASLSIVLSKTHNAPNFQS